MLNRIYNSTIVTLKGSIQMLLISYFNTFWAKVYYIYLKITIIIIHHIELSAPDWLLAGV